MYRSAVILSILVFLAISLAAQQPSGNATAQKASPYALIPVEAARAQNPVKSSPDSIARAKKWWNLDCAMCHGASGDGKGDIAKDMKLNVTDFTNANALKDRTDGEIYYIIKNGHNDMPAEGPRIKTEEGWDLVNYVRSLAKGKEAETKQ
ncbi:MAG TPA: cytochrome c [Candidatus Sulfotelmatobacter sp.]|nr:cytochrome c [Candidatus Sulfotelmatobacter sp.]